MDPRPRTVKGLCDYLGVPTVDLLLPCCFCNCFLTNLEKSLCDFSPFQLRWRDGCAFGCCQTCIRLCGRLEQKCFFQKVLSTNETKQLDLEKEPVRCQSCMRTLTLGEKKLCAQEGSFQVVRDRIRGTCGLCRLEQV
ncbi:oncoprotein E6 [Leopardus wiedii papillomavirus type 1]|uniref:Protein E6 n=1 Tax=Leopardus wiedii papillomavirus type 1 TaxID=2495531 RepID=A0A3S5HLT8_9PAPI|nr:oncoprotein E6 [Leopardus wiedii papillomavirus type 1]